MSEIKPIEIVIAGVQKAATSSLQSYMGQHPQLITHGEKEFTYFILDKEYDEGYEKAFPKYFNETDSAKKVLIKNVGIIYFENAVQRLYEHNPEAKIILMLRNPISRAYSAYWYARSKGYENEKTFELAINADKNRFKNKLNSHMVDYLGRGDYVKQLNNLYKFFKKEQVKIILSEDLKVNPENVFKELFDFCKVDASFRPNIKTKFNASGKARSPLLAKMMRQSTAIKTVLHKLLPAKSRYKLQTVINNLNKKEFIPPPINPETKKKLIAHYTPMIKELGIMLNRDLSDWTKVD